MNYTTALILATCTFLLGCEDNRTESAKKQAVAPAVAPLVPTNWTETQLQRRNAKAAYIAEHRVAFDWFSNFAFSNTDGVPYVVLKLLPKIAPEIWGSEENFLDIVGLFKDERQPGYPIARGIGISALSRSSSDREMVDTVDYATFTCAACHTGRVRKKDGGFTYLDGGINSEFNVALYRVKSYQTLQKIFGGEKDAEKKTDLANEAFLKALDDTEKTSNVFFYQNYQTANLNLGAEYEQKQLELFRKTSRAIIEKYVERTETEYTGYEVLLDTNYQSIKARSLQGFPGMVDATGMGTIGAYNDAQKSFWTRIIASLILPSKPGITDFMSVWEQGKRKGRWDEDHKTLIGGGGQWNGNIPIPMYRNLAAQLSIGLENNDIRVSAFAVELLDGLPATVYPFDVDVALAKKGQPLFEKNCAQCHQPHNDVVYNNLGTNSDRSYVVSNTIRSAAIGFFTSVCSANTTLDLAGQQVKPCAEFDGVPLDGKESLVMSPVDQQHGYNARPLNGVWADAPYLHNGSVPTIYHLLVPRERPNQFVKSRLDYDTKLLGFVWEPATSADNDGTRTAGYTFDTQSFSTFSNKGHDEDITEGTRTYKLNWEDDMEGAKAIVEYLKTL